MGFPCPAATLARSRGQEYVPSRIACVASPCLLTYSFPSRLHLCFAPSLVVWAVARQPQAAGVVPEDEGTLEGKWELYRNAQ